MPSIFNSFATLPQRLEDLFTGRAFEERANQMINSAHSASPREQLIGRTEALHSTCFAPEIGTLTAKRDEQLHGATQARAEASALQTRIADGSIPELVSGALTFLLPKSFASKLVFFTLLLAGLGLSVIEGLNLAWFLRFKTDSFLFAILCTIPIFAFPVVEAVIVHNQLVRPRTRHLIMLVQGALAAMALVAYIYYSLTFADTSLVISFEEQSGFSIEQLRMAFQILTSVLFSGICLLGADSLAVRQPPKNREYQRALARIKELQRNAARYAKAAEKFAGPLQRIQSRKQTMILRCHQKLDELNAAESAHRTSINKILSE
jgi:hypothetical protein